MLGGCYAYAVRTCYVRLSSHARPCVNRRDSRSRSSFRDALPRNYVSARARSLIRAGRLAEQQRSLRDDSRESDKHRPNDDGDVIVVTTAARINLIAGR